MDRVLPRAIVGFAILLLVLPLSTLAVKPPDAGKPDVAPSEAKKTSCNPMVVLENEETRIWFQGHKAHFKVFNLAPDGGVEGSYDYKTASIVELDADGNQLARMNIERAFPQSSSCEVTTEDEWVNLSIEMTGAVRGSGALGEATVTFKHHFNQSDDGGKFDVIVEDWPWQGDGELAFDFNVHSAEYTIEAAANGLGFQDAGGADAGHMNWSGNATATYEDDTTQESVVESASEVAPDGHSASVRLRYTAVDADYVHLLHDPWFGTGHYIILLDRLITEDEVPVRLPEPVWDLL